MKKHLFFCALAIAAASLTSCTTVKLTSQTADVTTAVVQYPTVTDLDVMPKASATTSWKLNIFKRMSLNTRKSNLVAHLLNEKGADVLLEEQFILEDHGLGNYTLTVTGYPARFTGFRKATEADLEALRAADPELYNVSKKKR